MVMKIIVDKVLTAPAHALTKSELKIVLSTLPADWMEGIELIRLRNDLHAPPIAEARIRGLVIYSRGRPKRAVVASILRALAEHALRIERGWRANLSAADYAMLQKRIQCPLEASMRKLEVPAPKENPISLAGFVEIKFGPQ
jgi:hypothetical protein